MEDPDKMIEKELNMGTKFTVNIGYCKVDYYRKGNDTFIEIRCHDCYVHILGVRGVDEIGVHYTVNVKVTWDESKGLKHGWGTYRFNRIEHYFYGEEAEKRFNVLEKNIRRLIKKYWLLI